METKEVTLEYNRLLLSLGSTFAVYYFSRRSGERKRARIIHGPDKSIFYVMFQEDDVDFEIEIDNCACTNRALRFQLDLNKISQAFIQKKNTKGVLETLHSRGGKFHLNRQSGAVGQRRISQEEKCTGLDEEAASLLMSRITFTTQYSAIVEEFPIHVDLCRGTGKRKRMTLIVEASDTVKMLKYKIRCKSRLFPDQQSLRLNEMLLYDDEIDSQAWTLSDYGIIKDTVLTLTYECRVAVLKQVDGRRKFFWVTSSDTVGKLKDKIDKEFGIHPDQQRLKWRERLLPDGLLLNWTEVSFRYPLVLTYGLYPISVIRAVGETMYLKVRSSTTIGCLKHMIESQEGGIPRKQQKLKYRGLHLNYNERTLKDHFIFDNATIVLLSKAYKSGNNVNNNKDDVQSESSSFQIFVKALSLPSFPVLVNSSTSVENLQAMIAEKDSVPPMEYYNPTYCGNVLSRGYDLTDYDIKENSTIHLLFPLRGGALLYNNRSYGPGGRYTSALMRRKQKIKNSSVGERGIITFKKLSNQLIPPASFDPDHSLDLESFTLEMRLVPNPLYHS